MFCDVDENEWFEYERKYVRNEIIIPLLLSAACFPFSMKLAELTYKELSKALAPTSKNNDLQNVDNQSIENGIQQILDVPGEDFKLKINYQALLEDNANLPITSDNSIYTEISTLGLPSAVKVYINNIRNYTPIGSSNPQIDGITKEIVDGSIINGYSISDTNSYYYVNKIAGQNADVMNDQKILESNFYANNIACLIDLIIVKDKEVSFTSVFSEVKIPLLSYTNDSIDNKYLTENDSKKLSLKK